MVVPHTRPSVAASDPVAAAPAHLYRNYQALVERAISVFGDAITASRWLSTPNPDFDNQIPLRVAQVQDYSLASFEPLFVRIEHGIY